MTNEEKGILTAGMVLGAVVSFLLIAICVGIAKKKDPMSLMHPNEVLNSDKYRIDTIMTICNNDTVLTYKFEEL